MKDLELRFHTEKPQKLSNLKSEVVFTSYLKWLENLARKQLSYNDALQLVSKSYSEKDMDMAYDKGYSDGQDTRAI